MQQYMPRAHAPHTSTTHLTFCQCNIVIKGFSVDVTKSKWLVVTPSSRRPRTKCFFHLFCIYTFFQVTTRKVGSGFLHFHVEEKSYWLIRGNGQKSDTKGTKSPTVCQSDGTRDKHTTKLEGTTPAHQCRWRERNQSAMERVGMSLPNIGYKVL